MKNVAFLLLVTAGNANAAADIEATLSVGSIQQTKPILSPGKLFGSFFEDFLHSGEGGMYGEKLSNRALALPLSDAHSFRCTGTVHTDPCTWYAESGSVTRDSSTPLNAAVQNAMWLAPASVATNAGFPGGIAVKNGDELSLSFYVYVPAGSASVTVRLVDGMTAATVLGSAVVTQKAAAQPQWEKVTAKIKVTQSSGSSGCRFQVVNAKSSAKIGITVVSLFPTETWMGRQNGLRTDVTSWLNESQPPFIRTPGGCYVEGHNLSASGWAWKKTLGPIEGRPGHMNDVWGYWTDDGLGMFEVLRMADDVGAQPLLVVNAGCSTETCVSGDALKPYIQDALDAVEYVTGASSTTWGGKRAAAGKAEPYELLALAIGNENCGSRTGAGYAPNFLTIATAVRAKYPHLPLIIGCETQDQLEDMLKREPGIAKIVQMYDVHQRKSPEQFLAAAHEFDTYPRTHYPKLFVSEYSSPRRLFPNSTTVGAAVAEAVYMAGMEANGDVVQLATYGDLVANTADNHGSAGVSTILIDAAGSFGSPSWVVQKLFMAAQPAALVPSTLNISSASPAPAPGPAIGVGIPGCCGGSHYNTDLTDCDKYGRGMWNARKSNITDLAACVARVARCKMGNFASFYPASATDDGSCGWHLSCAGWPSSIDSCPTIPHYVSARVHETAPTTTNCTAWVNGGSCDLGDEASPAMLAASVSVATTGEVQAKLMNYGTQEVSLAVQLPATLAATAATGTLAWMAGATEDVVNSFENPRRVGIQHKAVELDGGRAVLQLPAWSVGVFKVAGPGE